MPLPDINVPGGQDYLTRSTFLGDIERGDTSQSQYPGLMAPWQGVTPQAMLSMLQSPGMQRNMQQFGIQFDPSQVQQSPFFSNNFMQGHPRLGGALQGAMSGAAATPAAPLVSGAGSGISRAMQGAALGPEQLRQFQNNQLASPFRQMAAALPVGEYQRREQLLEGLLKDMQQRGANQDELLKFKEQWDQQYLAPMQQENMQLRQQQLNQTGEYQQQMGDIRQQLANQTGQFQQYREQNQGPLQQAYQLYKMMSPQGDQNGFIQFMQQLGLAQHPGAAQQGAFRGEANQRANVNSAASIQSRINYLESQVAPPPQSGIDPKTWETTRQGELQQLKRLQGQLPGFAAGENALVSPLAGTGGGQGGQGGQQQVGPQMFQGQQPGVYQTPQGNVIWDGQAVHPYQQ